MSVDEWFVTAEAAGLPGMPGTDRGVQLRAKAEGWDRPDRKWHPERNPNGLWRRRAGRGGGREYHVALLPTAARAALLKKRSGMAEPTRAAAKAKLARDEAWARFENLPEHRKERARARLLALDTVRTMILSGTSKEVAVQLVGDQQGFGKTAYYSWEAMVAGVPREDWLPHLADHRTGRTARAEISPEAWEFFKADYLRPSQPALSACYQRLKDAARSKGWTIPSLKTLQRRIAREINPAVVILEREGADALARVMPAQRRDRSVFHAMEAINYDGHKLDVFVNWPDGRVGRAILLAMQDLYSGKILAWRLDRSENAHAFKLTFGDMVERWGIPDHVYSDNTLAASAKDLTGGSRFRYRFKIREDDPTGLFTALGVELHFTRPRHGQSKPIERAFGELAEYIAKAPECEGAYTGNNPVNKPSNYGQRTVPLDLLIKVCEREIARFNARSDRTGSTARGRSFDAVFAESYAKSPIRTAAGLPPEMRRMWLLAAEGITCRRPDGSIHLHGNRYWHERLVGLIGKKVVVRFDPDHLHQPLHVYRLDGSFVCSAECVADVGFNDAEAAKQRAREERDYRRKVREIAEAEKRMPLDRLAALLPEAPAAAPIENRVVRPAAFRGGAAPALAVQADDIADEEFRETFAQGVNALRLVK